jgi:hypothetical protein
MKRMKNSWLGPVAALVVGVGVGYISGSHKSSAGDGSDGEKPAVRTRSSNRSENPAAEQSNKRASRPRSIEEISRLPGNTERLKALMDYYASLSPNQLADEARKLESLPMNERMVASLLLFGRWAESDPTAAMAFSNTMGFAGAFVRPTILQSWASADPANAAKYFTTNPREFAMMGMMGGGRGPMGGQSPAAIIAGEWARQDPAAALAWASTLTTDQSQAMNSVIGAVAKDDPKKAATMLASMAGTDKTEAYKSVASQYGALNFGEAQTWIRSLPAEDQAAAMAAAIGGLSKSDPQAAERQLGQMAAGAAKDEATAIVVKDMARLNPQGAADLLNRSSKEAQIQGMPQLIPTWVAQNPAETLKYVNSLEAGDVRDSALMPYIMSNNSSSPAELVNVAGAITNDRSRNRAIGIAAARWMREDPVAAKSYIQGSSLSDNAKQRILDGHGWGGGPGGP